MVEERWSFVFGRVAAFRRGRNQWWRNVGVSFLEELGSIRYTPTTSQFLVPGKTSTFTKTQLSDPEVPFVDT